MRIASRRRPAAKCAWTWPAAAIRRAGGAAASGGTGSSRRQRRRSTEVPKTSERVPRTKPQNVHQAAAPPVVRAVGN